MKDDFYIKFWGTRGSSPVAHADFMEFGGNTTCVQVVAGEHSIILDAGTGLVPLGFAIEKKQTPMPHHMFISHMHWDHIQGFPFFTPFFYPENQFVLHGERRNGKSLREQLSVLMSGPFFPVGLETLSAQVEYREFQVGDTIEVAPEFTVSTIRSTHPNICTAYRINYKEKSVCYLLDYEHRTNTNTDILSFAQDCDVLIYDSQYTDDEYFTKIGWGHSTWYEGIKFAANVNAKKLLLSHHAISRNDEDLSRMQESLNSILNYCIIAKEGMVVRP